MKLMHGDCLELMKEIPAGSVDMILTDPPYGTFCDFETRKGGAWDNVIPFEPMWMELERVLRPNGAVVLFGQEPFTSSLIKSAIPSIPFSYRAVWDKENYANHLMANTALLNYYEDINFFFKQGHDYKGDHPLRSYALKIGRHCGYSRRKMFKEYGSGALQHFLEANQNSTQFNLCVREAYQWLIENYKIDELSFFREWEDLKEEHEAFKQSIARTFNLGNRKHIPNIFKYKRPKERFHPTQKPTELLEELICIYSNERDTVLDFTAGSGSTGVACVNTNRDFIGIELDEGYFTIACKRIKEVQSQGGLF